MDLITATIASYLNRQWRKSRRSKEKKQCEVVIKRNGKVVAKRKVKL